MFKGIDRSPRLARFIAWLSEFMSKRRGLPVVIGIGFIVISFVIQILNVYADSKILQLIGVITLNVGVLTALIGLLLSDPLGK